MPPRELTGESLLPSPSSGVSNDQSMSDVADVTATSEEPIVIDGADNEPVTSASVYHPSKEEQALIKQHLDAFKGSRSDGKFTDSTSSVPGYGTVQHIVGIRRVPILRMEHAFLSAALHSFESEPGDGADDCLICRNGGDLFLCDTCDNAFHSICYNYTPEENAPFRCDICLGTRTVRELRVENLTRMKKLKRLDDASFFNDVLPEDDLNGKSWKPPTGEGAANVLKAKLGGGLHARMVYKRIDNQTHILTTPGAAVKKGASAMGSQEKRGNAQTPTIRAKLNSDKRANVDVERYRIEQGIGLWDVEDSYFRNASPESLKLLDGPFNSAMPKPKYITQTQYLVKFHSFSYRRCIWVPRVVLMYFRSLRNKITRFHQRMDSDDETIPQDTDEAGGEHGETVQFPTEYFDVERYVAVEFVNGQPNRVLVQWRGLEFSECTVEAYCDVQDDLLLQKYVTERTRAPLNSAMYRDALVNINNAITRKTSLVTNFTTTTTKQALYEEIQRDKMICLASINGEKVNMSPKIPKYPQADGQTSVQVQRYPWEEKLDPVTVAVRRHKLRSLPAEQRIVMELIYNLAPPPSSRQLRFYQYDGQCWLLSNLLQGRNSILADEMGLGKTMQSVTFLQIQREILRNPRPALILAPLSTLPHWMREVELCTSLSGVVYNGVLNSRKLLQNLVLFDNKKRIAKDVIICSYETFMTDVALFNRMQYSCIIVDEAHRLKNHSSKLYQLLLPLKTDSSLLLTGTPIQNNMQEMWSLLHFLDRKLFKSLDAFLKLYGNLQTTDQVQQLHQVLRPFLLRRTKANVEKALKPLKETVIEVELTAIQKRFYKAIYERNANLLMNMVKRRDQAPSLLNVAMQLRKCINHPFLLPSVEETHYAGVLSTVRESRAKHPGITDEADPKFNLLTADYSVLTDAQKELRDKGDYLAEASGKLKLLDKLLTRLRADGHKVQIFSQMTKMLDILSEYQYARQFPFERIDGSVSAGARQMAIDRFSLDDGLGFVFLLSTRAGGVGLNLTAADTVIIYDSDWNPQMDVQAQARAHRLGQEKDVRVFRLLGKNTYEMKMFDDASKKLGLDRAVLHSMGESTSKNIEEDVSNYGLTGDSKIVSDDKDDQKSKSDQILDSKNIERLLKEGLYGILNDNQDVEITDQSIDDILLGKGMARERTIEESGSSDAFSKATYGEGGVDISDPDFWAKMGISGQVDINEENQYLGKRKRQSVSTKNMDLSRETVAFSEDELASSSEEEEAEVMPEVKPLAKRRAMAKKPIFWTDGITSDMATWNDEEKAYYDDQCRQVGYSLFESVWHPSVLQMIFNVLFNYGYVSSQEMYDLLFADLCAHPFLDPRMPEKLLWTSEFASEMVTKGYSQKEVANMEILASKGYGYLNLGANVLRQLTLGIVKTALHYAVRTRPVVAAAVAAYNDSMHAPVLSASPQWDGTIPFASVLLNVWSFTPKAILVGKAISSCWQATELFRSPQFLYDLRACCEPVDISAVEPPKLSLECPLKNAGSKTIEIGQDVYYPQFLRGLDVSAPVLANYRQFLDLPNEAPFGTFTKIPGTSTVCVKSPMPEKELQPRSGPLLGTAFDTSYPFLLSSDTPPFGPVVRPYHGSTNSLALVALTLCNPNLAVNHAVRLNDFLRFNFKALMKSLQTSCIVARVQGNPQRTLLSEVIPAYNPATLATDYDHFPSSRPIFSGDPVTRSTPPSVGIVDASPAKDQEHPMLVYSPAMFTALTEVDLKRLPWWTFEHDRHILVGIFYLGCDIFNPKSRNTFIPRILYNPALCFHSIIQGRAWPPRSPEKQAQLQTKFEAVSQLARAQTQEEFTKNGMDADSVNTPVIGIDQHNYPIFPMSTEDVQYLSSFLNRRVRSYQATQQEELSRARTLAKHMHRIFHKNYLENLQNLKSICLLIRNGVTKAEDIESPKNLLTNEQYKESRSLSHNDVKFANSYKNDENIGTLQNNSSSILKIDQEQPSHIVKVSSATEQILALWRVSGLRALAPDEYPALKQSMLALLQIPNYLVDVSALREIKLKEIVKLLNMLAKIADDAKLALETTHGLVRLPYSHVSLLTDALKRILTTLSVVDRVKDMISVDTVNIIDGLFQKVNQLYAAVSKLSVVVQEMATIEGCTQLLVWPKTQNESDLLYMSTSDKNQYQVGFEQLPALFK